MPERPLFSRDKVDPSASIVLKVRGTLDQSQVRAIRHLVATAVNGLSPQRISIVDEQGQLLADGATDPNSGSDVSADERQASFEKRLRQQVETIVSSVVGPGHSRVQVNAEFDFNRITQTSDKYDPDGRVIRSSQTREESTGSTEANQQVTVGNELPGANQKPPPAADVGSRDQSKKTEEIVNYEISKTSRTEVIEGGRVNRLSVAVLVDGTYGKDDKGDITYQPRSKEELDQIATLVRSAIGFNQKRGDQVDVVNLRFADTPAHANPRADRLARGAAFHQGRHHARHRNGGDGHSQPRRPAVRGPAAGAPHRHAGSAEGAGRRARSRHARHASGVRRSTRNRRANPASPPR